MEISDPIVMTVAGGIVTALTGTITKLYLDNNNLRAENGAIRDKYQEKIETFIKSLTELMVTSANQTNTFSNSITTITSNVAAFQDKILTSFTSLREELIKSGKKE